MQFLRFHTFSIIIYQLRKKLHASRQIKLFNLFHQDRKQKVFLQQVCCACCERKKSELRKLQQHKKVKRSPNWKAAVTVKNAVDVFFSKKCLQKSYFSAHSKFIGTFLHSCAESIKFTLTIACLDLEFDKMTRTRFSE